MSFQRFTVNVWQVTDDLRIADNQAFFAAMDAKIPTLALHILNSGARADGEASFWWRRRSLISLHRELARIGVPLLIFPNQGHLVAELSKCLNVNSVYSNIRSNGAAAGGLAADWRASGIPFHPFFGDLLIEPGSAINRSGGPFRVFTPFWKHVLATRDIPAPLKKAAPQNEPDLCDSLSGRLETVDLEKDFPEPAWATRMLEGWTIGEAGARKQLENFLDNGLKGYKTGRDRPSQKSVSGLSPHLRFGEISAGTVWHAARHRAMAEPGLAPDCDKFLSELGWRDFSYSLLNEFPGIAENNLMTRFDAFPWGDDEAAFDAWRKGQTGYPFVDAGMRQLWQTGYMHNRVRMVVASFLVKHLLVHWRRGEEWFWNTLVDADPANNPASWQWTAGCGMDAAPYFRVFNPITQGEKFDPDGIYVRKYVPELAGLPNRYIHRPFDAPPLELLSAGIRPGETYPHPIVDHNFARKRALEAFDLIKSARPPVPAELSMES